MPLRLVTLLAVGLLAGAAVALLLRGGGATPQEQRADAQAYLETVEPIARDGGQIVQQRFKPAVADVADPDQPLPTTEAWPDDMAAVRARWQAITPPPALAEAHRLFLQALDRYVSAAETLHRATEQPAQRTDLAEEAAARGREGDELYDQAATLVQQHLADLGQDPVVWLPQAAS